MNNDNFNIKKTRVYKLTQPIIAVSVLIFSLGHTIDNWSDRIYYSNQFKKTQDKRLDLMDKIFELNNLNNTELVQASINKNNYYHINHKTGKKEFNPLLNKEGKVIIDLDFKNDSKTKIRGYSGLDVKDFSKIKNNQLEYFVITNIHDYGGDILYHGNKTEMLKQHSEIIDMKKKLRTDILNDYKKIKKYIKFYNKKYHNDYDWITIREINTIEDDKLKNEMYKLYNN